MVLYYFSTPASGCGRSLLLLSVFFIDMLPCSLGNLFFFPLSVLWLFVHCTGAKTLTLISHLEFASIFLILTLFSSSLSPPGSCFLFLSPNFLFLCPSLALFHSVRALYTRCWNQTVERGECTHEHAHTNQKRKNLQHVQLSSGLALCVHRGGVVALQLRHSSHGFLSPFFSVSVFWQFIKLVQASVVLKCQGNIP